MKNTFLIIFAGLIFFAYQPVNGQLLNKLRRQAERKSEEHALKEADKAADKGLDKAADAIWGAIEGEEDKSDTTSEGSDHNVNFNLQIGGGTPAPTESSYTFDTQVAYQFIVEDPESKDEETIMDLISWYQEGKEYTATKMHVTNDEQPINVLTIFDLKNESMIMIMEDDKIAQVISTKEKSEEPTNNHVQGDSNTTFKKTGRTKKILGYTCYEYKMHNEDADGTFWIAPDAKVHSATLFQGGIFGKEAPELDIPKDQQGMLMEMNSVVTDSDGKKTNMKILIKSIDKKNLKINMSDYQKMSLGASFHSGN